MGAHNIDWILCATTAAGDPLWQRTYGTELVDEIVRDVAISTSGRIVVTGNSETHSSYDERLFTAGVDGAGNLIWSNYTADHDTLSVGMKIVRSSSDRFMILGKSHAEVDPFLTWFSFAKGISADGVYE